MLGEIIISYESVLENTRNLAKQACLPLKQEKASDVLLLFWIHACIQTIGLTQSVEKWVKEMGEKTIAIGHEKLGQKIVDYAAVVDDQLLLQSDVDKLIRKWNKNSNRQLNAKKLLDAPYRNTVADVQRVYSDCLNGDYPYGHIAIKYEVDKFIEFIITDLLKNTCNALGEDIVEALSFLNSVYVEPPEALAKYDNLEMLEHALKLSDASFNNLVEIGKKTLNVHSAFFMDIYKLAHSMAKQQSTL